MKITRCHKVMSATLSCALLVALIMLSGCSRLSTSLAKLDSELEAQAPPLELTLEELFIHLDAVARVRFVSVEEYLQTPGKNEKYEVNMAFKLDVLEWLKGGDGSTQVWGMVHLDKASGTDEEEARAIAKYYFDRLDSTLHDREAIVFMTETHPDIPSANHPGRYALGGLGIAGEYGQESYSIWENLAYWLPSSTGNGASGSSEEQSFLWNEPPGISTAGGGVFGSSDGSVSLTALRRLGGMSESELQSRVSSKYGFMWVIEGETLPDELSLWFLAAESTTHPNKVLVRWTASEGANNIAGYRLLRRKQTDDEFIEVANIQAHDSQSYKYEDTIDIQPNTKYIYRLRVYTAYGDVGDARIAITTVPALEPLSGAASTSTPTASPTPLQPTATVVPTATPAAAPAPSHTPMPTTTHTSSPTPTSTPDPTSTPESSTGGGVSGAIDTPTHTPTSTHTPTATATHTPTTAPTYTATPDGSGDVVSGQ